MATNTGNSIFGLQVAILLELCIAHGWNGATFTPKDDPPNTLVHLIVPVLMLIFGTQFILGHEQELRGEAASHWGRIGITVLAIITIIADFVLIYIGATNPDPDSVGVHDFSDWVPAAMTLLGSFVGLATLFLARQGGKTDIRVNNQ
jgi:hypothetical protein